MAIPRLEASANPYELNVTINVKLRPYFEIWFQRKKEAGETPEQFALRILKHQALNDYLVDTVKTEVDSIEQDKADALVALQADADLMGAEVD